MDAIVLVGGLGTRLRPLTWQRHKSLVPVVNRPAIDYLFDWLGRSGFERVVLALGLENEDLARAYEGTRPAGMKLVIVREHHRMESGGAIRHAVLEAGVEGRFTVVNGDVFVDFDFRACLERHLSAEADLTLALHPVSEPWSFGVAAVDGSGMVTGFVEKPPRGTEPSNLVNAGVWIFEPGLVDEIPPGAVRVEDTLFPSLVARRRRVLGYEFGGIWADIGTPARYLELNTALLDRSPEGALAEDVAVAPTATVTRSSLGTGSRVGERATVANSIAWEHVEIGEGAVVEGSILANDVQIGPGASISGAVIGAGASVGAGAHLPVGASVEPGVHV